METNPLARSFHPFHGPSHLIDLIAARYGADEARQITDLLVQAQAKAIPWLTLLLTLAELLAPLVPPPFSSLLQAIIALLGGK